MFIVLDKSIWEKMDGARKKNHKGFHLSKNYLYLYSYTFSLFYIHRSSATLHFGFCGFSV
jgi:hypothetical protein